MKRSAVINAKHVKKIKVSWIRRKIFTVGIILLTFVLGALSSHIISEPKANAARAGQYKVVWVPTPKVVGVTFGRHIEDLLNKEAEQGGDFTLIQVNFSFSNVEV